MQQMVICLQGQSTRVKTLEAISLRLTQEFCGCCSLTLRVSAIRLSSGSERAFIFRIRWVRCTFTVDSAIPISLAICLLRRPATHDLTLAWAERVEALPERSQSPFTLPAGTIASETGLHGVKQVLITEWLCEELYGAALHRLHGHRHVGMRCDEDDRHLPVRSGKVALKLKTASPRHPHVEYKASWALRRIDLEKIRN